MGWPKIKIKPPSLPEVLETVENLDEVIQVVQIVAGILLAADEVEGPQDPHVKMYHLYEKACNKLEESTLIPDPDPKSLLDHEIRSGTLLSCWFNPITATSSGDFAANQDLYKEVASFLTLSGAPAKLEYGAKGKYEDTASLVADIVFDKRPPDIQANNNPDEAITVTERVLTNITKDCSIIVKNACYNVPLGGQVSTTAWHGGLQVQTKMTKEFHQVQLAKLPPKGTPLPQRASGDWMWLSTIKVYWATSSVAENSGQLIPSRFQKQNPGFYVTLASVIGTLLTVQIAGPRGVKPAAIEAKLSATVAEYVQADEREVLAMPKVDLVSSSLV